MPTLYITKGLPGSGKTTWAKEHVANMPEGTAVIVCKDDIRKELAATGWEWSPENEKQVINLRDAQIEQAFYKGVTVVISADTNFGKHEAHLINLAKKLRVAYSIVSFLDVPLNVCIERDARREEGRVGEKVIREMYQKYVEPAPEVVPYVPKAGSTPAIIVDIDGTVAIKHDRSPFDYSRVDHDLPNEPIVSLVNLLANLSNLEVIYCSGRDDSCRQLTTDWLAKQGLPAGPLFMRATGDHRKDFIVKQELFDANIRDNYDIKYVLDDRNQVVNMWRRLGLTCLQVAEGNF